MSANCKSTIPRPYSGCSLLSAFAAPSSLTKAIAANLAAHELTSKTAGLEELFQAVESLYQSVAELLGEGGA